MFGLGLAIGPLRGPMAGTGSFTPPQVPHSLRTRSHVTGMFFRSPQRPLPVVAGSLMPSTAEAPAGAFPPAAFGGSPPTRVKR